MVKLVIIVWYIFIIIHFRNPPGEMSEPWVEKVQDGKLYYENTATGKLSIAKPPSYEVPEGGVDHSVEVALQDGNWTERTSKAGKTYYWNETEGKATWDLQRHLREMEEGALERSAATMSTLVKASPAVVPTSATPAAAVPRAAEEVQTAPSIGTPIVAAVSLTLPTPAVTFTNNAPVIVDQIPLAVEPIVSLPVASTSAPIPAVSSEPVTSMPSAEQQISIVKEEQKKTQAQLASVIREYDHSIRIAPDWVLKKTVAQRKEALHRAEVALKDIQRSIGPHGVLPLVKPPVCVSPEPPSVPQSPRFPRFVKPPQPPFGSLPSVVGRSQSPVRLASPISQILRPAIEPPPSSIESRPGWSIIEEEAWKQLACLGSV